MSWKALLIEGANPELLQFMEWMNNEIEVNEKTKGFNWRTMNFDDPQQFLDELKKHTVKLEVAMATNKLERIKEHIADDFCYLMFLAICYKLIPKPEIIFKVIKHNPYLRDEIE